MKKFWSIVILFVVAILVIPVFLPDSRHLEKKIVVNQTLEKSFSTVANLNNWTNWFHGIKQDSCGEISILEATDTTKARINWITEHGDGALILKKSIKDSLLVFRVKICRPKKRCMKWIFQPLGDSTEVTLSFDSDLRYPIGRFFGVFKKEKVMGFMETMMTSYKIFVESIPREMPKVEKQVDFEEVTMEAKPALSVEINTDMAHISEEMSKAYSQIMNYIKTNGLEVVGAPYSLYEKWNPPTEIVFVSGVPINKSVKGKNEIKQSETPSGKMLKVVYFGAYNKTAYIYNAYDEYIKKNGIETRGGPWEEYITNPTMELDTTKWQTNIYFQIK